MAHEYHAQSAFKRRDAGSIHACEHLQGDDPCVSGFCSRPPLAPWPSCRGRHRRTGTARRTRMWTHRSASASSYAMVPRWCITTTAANGTCARSRGPATSGTMRRARAGSGPGVISRGIFIGAIVTTGRGSPDPGRITSSMATASAGCMRPGTMDVPQCATASSTDTPAPTTAANGNGVVSIGAGPGTLAGRPRLPCWASQKHENSHATAQGGGAQAGVLERGRNGSGGHASTRGGRDVRAQLRPRLCPARVGQLPDVRRRRGPGPIRQGRPTATAGSACCSTRAAGPPR
jgi:hypothetical protein